MLCYYWYYIFVLFTINIYFKKLQKHVIRLCNVQEKAALSKTWQLTPKQYQKINGTKAQRNKLKVVDLQHDPIRMLTPPLHPIRSRAWSRPRTSWRDYVSQVGSWVSHQELEEVAGERAVWASWLQLLPPQPQPVWAAENGWMVQGKKNMWIWFWGWAVALNSQAFGG